MATSEKDLELQVERSGRKADESQSCDLCSNGGIAAMLAMIIAVLGAATLGVVVNIKTSVDNHQAAANVEVMMSQASPMSGDNYCDATKPTPPNFINVDCASAAVEQAGGNVTLGWVGKMTATGTPINKPFFHEGLCPVNVHWHLGAEHLSWGEYDGYGYGPGSEHRRRLRTAEEEKAIGEEDARRLGAGARLGGRCHKYDSTDPKFTTPYDWKHCSSSMIVGETYEVHWPHSEMGACGTPNQYQSPFYDGVFCNLAESTASSVGSASTGNVPLATDSGIGVQAQIFTIVNDENYYYPDLMRGMIVDGEKGTQITGYTGSTTGTTRNNEICSAFAPITWHVDRKCHLISASSFDKMCADMKSQRDDMSYDLEAHGAREYVIGRYVANNQMDLTPAYTARYTPSPTPAP